MSDIEPKSVEPVVGIVPANIRGVLLSDGWHPVEPGTFRAGRLDGVDAGQVSPIWFSFKCDSAERIAGPVTSIVAVREF